MLAITKVRLNHHWKNRKDWLDFPLETSLQHPLKLRLRSILVFVLDKLIYRWSGKQISILPHNEQFTGISFGFSSVLWYLRKIKRSFLNFSARSIETDVAQKRKHGHAVKDNNNHLRMEQSKHENLLKNEKLNKRLLNNQIVEKNFDSLTVFIWCVVSGLKAWNFLKSSSSKLKRFLN